MVVDGCFYLLLNCHDFTSTALNNKFLKHHDEDWCHLLVANLWYFLQ